MFIFKIRHEFGNGAFFHLHILHSTSISVITRSLSDCGTVCSQTLHHFNAVTQSLKDAPQEGKVAQPLTEHEDD